MAGAERSGDGLRKFQFGLFESTQRVAEHKTTTMQVRHISGSGIASILGQIQTTPEQPTLAHPTCVSLGIL